VPIKRRCRWVWGEGEGLSALRTLLQVRPYHVTAGALQTHQQSVVGLLAAITGFQVVLHLCQQMGGHFGIGQGPVSAA
jgi:hypothetical protein